MKRKTLYHINWSNFDNKKKLWSIIVGMLYLLNSLIIPISPQAKGVEVRIRRVSADEARALASGGFMSAVGHEATCRALSTLLGVEVPLNRVQVFLRKGDRALHFVLRARLPEGTIIGSPEELEKIGYDLLVSEVVAEELEG